MQYCYIFLTKRKKGMVRFILELAEMLSNDNGQQLQYNMPMSATKSTVKNETSQITKHLRKYNFHKWIIHQIKFNGGRETQYAKSLKYIITCNPHRRSVVWTMRKRRLRVWVPCLKSTSLKWWKKVSNQRF